MKKYINRDYDAVIIGSGFGGSVSALRLAEKGYKNIDAFEIDKHLKNESSVKITYDDFITLKSEKKYDVIIGNPPYVRWKHLNKQTQHNLSTSKNLSGRINGLMDLLHGFILRSLDSLKEDGELILSRQPFGQKPYTHRVLEKKCCKLVNWKPWFCWMKPRFLMVYLLAF